jgi:hypothetical protein
MYNDYCIVDAKTTEDLAPLVKAKLAEGWEPLGGVATQSHPHRNIHKVSQAMGRSDTASLSSLLPEVRDPRVFLESNGDE